MPILIYISRLLHCAEGTTFSRGGAVFREYGGVEWRRNRLGQADYTSVVKQQVAEHWQLNMYIRSPE